MWRFGVRHGDPDNCKQDMEWCRISWSVGAICFVLTAIIALSGCGQKKPPAVGEAPPKFTLTDLKGDKVTVPDAFTGKVIIIRFWVDSCKSCAKEMPMLDHTYNKYKDRGLVVLAVNVGQKKDVAEAFVTNLKITYPVLLDPDSAITKQYGVKAVPFTLIIDRKGITRKRILGEAGSETIEKMIQDFL